MNLSTVLLKFEHHLLTERRLSLHTVNAYTADARQLVLFCAHQDIILPDQLTVLLVKKFLAHLKKTIRKNVSFARKIASVRSFCAFCTERYGAPPIAPQLITPKLEKTLPKALAQKALVALLHQATVAKGPTASRDRALIYLLYATGMRVSELIQLRVDAFEHPGFVRVFGKGSKERLVPLTQQVQEFVAEYIHQERPRLLGASQSHVVFFSRWGGAVKPLTRQAVWKIVRRLGASLRASGLKISPHVLRHSLATHLLQNGMDLRSLQVLLGHEQLSTVQIYTKVETSFLRKTYNKKHHRS